MNSKKVLLLSSCVAVALLAIVGFFTWANWSNVGEAFFSYSFVDIVNIIVTVVIGIVITVYLSLKAGNHSKKAEIVSGNIDALLEINKSIIDSFARGLGKRMGQDEQRYYNSTFKCVSIELNNCDEYLRMLFPRDQDIERTIQEIKYLVFSLKKTITDEPFSVGHLVDIADINKANKDYYDIKSRFQKIKMLLYE